MALAKVIVDFFHRIWV